MQRMMVGIHLTQALGRNQLAVRNCTSPKRSGMLAPSAFLSPPLLCVGTFPLMCTVIHCRTDLVLDPVCTDEHVRLCGRSIGKMKCVHCRSRCAVDRFRVGQKLFAGVNRAPLWKMLYQHIDHVRSVHGRRPIWMVDVLSVSDGYMSNAAYALGTITLQNSNPSRFQSDLRRYTAGPVGGGMDV